MWLMMVTDGQAQPHPLSPHKTPRAISILFDNGTRVYMELLLSLLAHRASTSAQLRAARRDTHTTLCPNFGASFFYSISDNSRCSSNGRVVVVVVVMKAKVVKQKYALASDGIGF